MAFFCSHYTPPHAVQSSALRASPATATPMTQPSRMSAGLADISTRMRDHHLQLSLFRSELIVRPVLHHHHQLGSATLDLRLNSTVSSRLLNDTVGLRNVPLV